MDNLLPNHLIIKATFKAGDELESTRVAPHEGETVFIIGRDILIHDDEVITDFDTVYYYKIFQIDECYE